MDLNRILTIVLGFIILILLFVWISNRFRANTRSSQTTAVPTATSTPTPVVTGSARWNVLSLFQRGTPTPTSTSSVSKGGVVVSPTPTKTQVSTYLSPNPQNDSTYRNYKTGQLSTVNEIPDTGASTVIMSLAFAAMAGGIYLRKRV